MYKKCIMKEKSVELNVHHSEHIQLVVLGKKSMLSCFSQKVIQYIIEYILVIVFFFQKVIKSYNSI